ncbi:hypothetical protein B0H34DRAFT_542013 [Crassisporium funariophilum]|nr:hypothetical protein B0H34DRAFT_542013 [Crassisporium funariophilum]
MKLSSAILSLLFICGRVVATALASEGVCEGPAVTVADTWIGEAKNVQMTTLSCLKVLEAREPLVQRQTNVTNVCGTKCNTNCFSPAGGGPDPNDCHIIADALRFESQNTGALFQIGNSTNNTIVMQFSSCKTFFVNQDFGPLAYCRTDWVCTILFTSGL